MFFNSTSRLEFSTDLHSHLVPGVDDGVKTIEEAVQLITAFQKLGYKKLITTPHISENYYPNSVDYLRTHFDELREEIDRNGIKMDLQLGAEYMVDGMLLASLRDKNELLSWNGHLLIETSFQALPLFVNEVIFEIQARNLIPVLAHPERYAYFFGKIDELIELREKGVKMQITAGSLAGYYGSEEKKMAKKLLEKNAVDFIGSDVHGQRHIEFLEKGLSNRILRNRLPSDFQNESLMG